MIDAALSGRRLLFEFTPFRSGSVTAEFGLEGLADHIGELAAACQWNKTKSAGRESSPAADVAKSIVEPQSAVAEQTYFEFQVEKQVAVLPGYSGPIYPAELRPANVRGEVLAQFIVDTGGVADLRTFKVLKSDHGLFTNAVLAALPSMRFSAAEIGGRKVRQLVQMPFQFSLR